MTAAHALAWAETARVALRQRHAQERIWRQCWEREALAGGARLPASLEVRVRQGYRDQLAAGAHVFDAQGEAQHIIAGLRRARVGAAYDEGLIKDCADNYARLCGRMQSVAARVSFAIGLGIEPPAGKRQRPASLAARLDDPKWWRRQLRKCWTRAAEDAHRRLGIVRRGGEVYASDAAVRHRAARQAAAAAWMQGQVLENERGEQLEMWALHERSLSNPALRRGEFMCRMRGFEECAQAAGHVALFFTLTAPSAFHAQHAGGGENARWAAAGRPSVREAQAWLQVAWARARAKLARLSVLVYGFRVAEPHHDGTPHWHMVLFVPPAAVDLLETVLRGFWLAEYADEPGARARRVQCVRINPEQGSATGYVSKYVSKNIDAAGSIGEAVSDESGEAVRAGVARVATWASVYGIRQFQQIGGPPVGLWRELRRQRETVEHPGIEAARAAADTGQWRAFIDALGGLERARRRVPCLAEKFRRACAVTPANAADYPAVWLDRSAARRYDRRGRDVLAAGAYGDEPAPRACGVVALGLLGRWCSVATRPHRWRVTRAAAEFSLSGSRLFSDLGPVAITVRAPDGVPTVPDREQSAEAAGVGW